MNPDGIIYHHGRRWWVQISAATFVVTVAVIGYLMSTKELDVTETRVMKIRGDNSNNYNNAQQQILLDIQAQAKNALHKLLESKRALDTNVSHRDFVLHNGFPLSWQSCTLPRLFLDKYVTKEKEGKHNNSSSPFNIMKSSISASTKTTTINLVVLGGSLSSASAKNCQLPGDLLSGRYSNILQRALNENIFHLDGFKEQNSTLASNNVSDNDNTLPTVLKFNVTNMAQGGMDSVWTGMHLDELVDPQQTDLILWEFAVNDHHGSASTDWSFVPAEHVKRLDFWLRRVNSLYSSSTRHQPPPMILLYTWEYGIGKKPKDYVLDHGLQAGPLNSVWGLIREYRSLGWNLQVINVGGSVDKNLFANNPLLFLDDLHHAGCLGVHFIANMIQYALYSDIASCDVTNHHEWRKKSNSATLPPLQSGQFSNFSDLASLLFQETIQLGSLTPWIPNAGTSVIRIGSNLTDLGRFVKNFVPQGVSETRADRKFSYSLSSCSDSTPKWKLTLLEPNLIWLGLDLNDASVTMKINQVTTVSLESNGKQLSGLDWVQTWVNVAETVLRSSNYTVTLCKRRDDKDVFLHGIVAVLQNDRV